MVPWAHTWGRGDRPVLQVLGRPRGLTGLGARLPGFVPKEVILVDVHHQELVELHVLLPL